MIAWSLPPAEVRLFLAEASAAVRVLAARPRAAAWAKLGYLIDDAAWRSAGDVAREATARCQAYASVGGVYGRALAAWYRALALVMFAADHRQRQAAASCGWCGSTLPPAQHPRGRCWARP